MFFLSRLLRLQFPVRKSSRKRCHFRTCLEQLELRIVLSSWVGQIGGVGTDTTDNRHVMDSAGNIYVGGDFSATADFDLGPGTATLTSAGSSDAYIAKYKPDDSLQWARRFGGVGYDAAQTNVVVNPTDGSLYLGGHFEQNVDFNPTSPGGELTSAGSTDGVLLKLNASGEYLSAWRMGGIGLEAPVMPIGLIGNTIYAAGRFEATADFPTGHTLTSFGGADGFLMALDDAPLAPSALLAAAPPANFVEQSLTKFDSLEGLSVLSTTAFADFNNDGLLDMAAVTSPTTITVSLAKPDGSYTVSAILTAPKSQPIGGVYVGDYNGDGKLDIRGDGSSNSGIYSHTWLGNGDGTFGARDTQRSRFPRFFI